MSKYLRTIKNKPTNWKQFLSSDKYTLGLIKKYSNLEFQGVFLRSFELESRGSERDYCWYPAPGSLLAFPHLCLAPPALGGPRHMWIMKFIGPDSALGHPLTPISCFLATLEVCVPFWLVLGIGTLGGGIGRRWKGLRVI